MSWHEFCQNECSNIQPELCQKLPKASVNVRLTLLTKCQRRCVSVCVLSTLCGLGKIPQKVKLVHPILVINECAVQSFQLFKKTNKKLFKEIMKSPKIQLMSIMSIYEPL